MTKEIFKDLLAGKYLCYDHLDDELIIQMLYLGWGVPTHIEIEWSFRTALKLDSDDNILEAVEIRDRQVCPTHVVGVNTDNSTVVWLEDIHACLQKLGRL